MPPPEPSPTISRRNLTKGAAWATPVVLATATAPAYAASTCLDRARIDQAFAATTEYARANYYCNGEPAKLQINFYQSVAALDSCATDVYVNVKNLSGCNINFSDLYPLQLDIQVRNNNVLSTTSTGRSLTSVNTSWDTETVTDNNVSGAPVGSVDADINWNFSGTLPGAGLGDNEADLRIGFGGGTASQNGIW
ncbi:hypothetical protein VVR12_07175 [Rothia sp. LK2588]|uniref:hypothetical protein n=1 Tax=Rothia sp. LK2588 TaxID=3114369 RepID=UPI0034CF17CF